MTPYHSFTVQMPITVINMLYCTCCVLCSDTLRQRHHQRLPGILYTTRPPTKTNIITSATLSCSTLRRPALRPSNTHMVDSRLSISHTHTHTSVSSPHTHITPPLCYTLTPPSPQYNITMFSPLIPSQSSQIKEQCTYYHRLLRN